MTSQIPPVATQTRYRDQHLLYSLVLYVVFWGGGSGGDAQKCKFCTFLSPLGGKICNKRMKRCLCLMSSLGLGGWQKTPWSGDLTLFSQFLVFFWEQPWDGGA